MSDEAQFQPTKAVEPSPLAAACAFWQAGRDGGSSLLRGAARVITQVPHYFQADFIADYDERARQDPDALTHARTLLTALRASALRSASEWARDTGVPDRAFAGRGLGEKLAVDPDIEERLDSGQIDMPLWGVSLDPDIASSYGTRFLLEIVGSFPGIPAWRHSVVKAEEQELITGGQYRVVDIHRTNGRTHARLQWESALHPSP